MGYPTKKQSFHKKKDCFFVGYPKFFWPFLFWSGFSTIYWYNPAQLQLIREANFVSGILLKCNSLRILNQFQVVSVLHCKNNFLSYKVQLNCKNDTKATIPSLEFSTASLAQGIALSLSSRFTILEKKSCEFRVLTYVFF